MQNPVIDLIIRIKNGYMAKKDSISTPYSSFKEEVLKKLKQLGYVADYSVHGEVKKYLEVDLLYTDGQTALTDVKIFSKPGQRWYVSYRSLKPVLNNFGYGILSTPKGIMSDKEAKKAKLGGELLFNIW